MQAAVLKSFGGPDKFSYEKIAKPEITKDTQVLVKVHAAGANVGDAIIRSGRIKMFPLKFPCIMGLDYAGIVEKVGAKSTFKAGQVVYGHLKFPRSGTYAEYVIVDELKDLILSKPESIGFDQSAICVPALTAYSALVNVGGIAKKSQPLDILVIGASGAVGSFSVMIASQIYKANVVGICSGSNIEYVKSLGSNRVIDYKTNDVSKILETESLQFDIIVDTIGGTEYYLKTLSRLKKKGVYAAVAGPAQVAQGEEVGCCGFIFGFIGKSLWRSTDGKYKMVAQGMNKEFQVLDSWLKEEKLNLSALKIKKFALSEVSMAHTEIDSCRTVGKIVLIP